MAETAFLARLVAGRVEAEDAPALPFWSFSKTILAALCHEAAARGEVALDAPCPGRAWSLRDLLGHRAGLGDYFSVPEYRAAVLRGDPPWSTRRYLEEVSPDAPLFAPRGGWAYSNIGYLLARQALESATGQGFAELLRTRLTAFPSLRLAETPEDFAALPFDAKGYHPGWVAHGCVMGTPADAMRLLAHILDRFPRIDAPHDLGGPVPDRIWARAGYGQGLMSGIAERAGRAVGHSGGGPFSACAIYAFPDLPGAPVTAAFVPGGNEAPAERIARDLALRRDGRATV